MTNILNAGTFALYFKVLICFISFSLTITVSEEEQDVDMGDYDSDESYEPSYDLTLG